MMDVEAHPGRTDGSGCHTCRTNCSKYGLQNGEYHCHNGSSNNSSQSTTNTSNNSVIYSQKSSDNTLKTVTIDNKEILVSNTMNYKTKNEEVLINVVPSSSKAKYVINNKKLNIGENYITINVTAENGSVKTYTLNIVREQLSNNTNIKVIINGEEIKFKDYEATINVSNETEKVDYNYYLEDKNAKVKIKEIERLKEGKNVMKFIVTAEDKTTQEYRITINKEEKTQNVFLYILFSGIVGTILAYLTNKKKIKK